MKTARFVLLTPALYLMVGVAAQAMPKVLIDAAKQVEDGGSYRVRIEVKRHLPLTSNLGHESYELDARTMTSGKWDLLLRGKAGTNKDRTLSCTTPCDSAVVKWPNRPAVRLHKGDARLYLSETITPSGELRFVANITDTKLEKTEPLPRENATRYTYRLARGEGIPFYVSQLWSVPYNENKERIRVLVTLDNKTDLPKKLTITKKPIEGTNMAQTVYEKVWYFSYH